MHHVDSQGCRGHPFDGRLGDAFERFGPLADEIDGPENAYSQRDLRGAEAVVEEIKYRFAVAQAIYKRIGKQGYIGGANCYGREEIFERDFLRVGANDLIADHIVGDIGDEHCVAFHDREIVLNGMEWFKRLVFSYTDNDIVSVKELGADLAKQLSVNR